MRELHGHETNDCNKQIRITADDQNPENGNASHVYDLACGTGPDGHQAAHVRIQFQDGPIGEVGVNGATNEALLAIVIDRLQCFQTSVYVNEFNERALTSVRTAMMHLALRTADRAKRGVEGTHEV